MCSLKGKIMLTFLVDSGWVLKFLIKCVAVMFLVLVGELLANVWFISAVPKLLHPCYFFKCRSICFEGVTSFFLRLHEHLVQPSPLLNRNLLFHLSFLPDALLLVRFFVLLWPLSTFDGHRIVIWSVAATPFHAWKRAMLMLTHFDSRAATSWCY